MTQPWDVQSYLPFIRERLLAAHPRRSPVNQARHRRDPGSFVSCLGFGSPSECYTVASCDPGYRIVNKPRARTAPPTTFSDELRDYSADALFPTSKTGMIEGSFLQQADLRHVLSVLAPPRPIATLDTTTRYQAQPELNSARTLDTAGARLNCRCVVLHGRHEKVDQSALLTEVLEFV